MATGRQSRASIPSFETSLENEEEVLDQMMSALSKNALDAELWKELHEAAVKHDRASQLAFAYESAAAGRKLKTFLPQVQAEVLYRAATFFADQLGDEVGASTYLEKALAAFAGHVGAFERLDALLERAQDHKRLAELSIQTAQHRPRAEQLELLRRAAILFERAGLDDKSIETFQSLVRLEPADEELRNALEQRFIKANRFRDVARMLEQALGTEPAPAQDEQNRIRSKLIEVFASQLKEPERAMPHVEALLEKDPENAEARRVATRLLESKGLAARAAAALVAGATSTEERTKYLGIELEHTRGPRRRDVLRRIGILKQDELGDTQGAFEAFEQALGIDPADDELRQRYVQLGSAIKGPLEVARTFARVSTVAKDAGVRSRITAEMGDLLLKGGDMKRARTTLAGVLAAPSADPVAVLTAARALATVYAGEGDVKNLVEVLGKIGELSSNEDEKQAANERIAEICGNELHDIERAIAAWRRLVNSPARQRALAALEPLYEERKQWGDLAFVLEERAKDTEDEAEARALAFHAAEVRTSQAGDPAAAVESWRALIMRFGAARDAYAHYLPLLESERKWPELAEALTKDAELAGEDEQPEILARLGNVYLQRTRETDLAIEAFKKALDLDASEKTSRSTLEKLLLGAEHRLAAAGVLEPIYRGEQNGQGLLRVLEIRAASSPIVQDRLAAFEEAARVAETVSEEKAVEIVSRALGEAVESAEPIAPWLEKFEKYGASLDPKRRAALLIKALGEKEIDSQELMGLAMRAGEESANAGDVAAALAAYRRALAFEPSSPELVARVDQLLQEQGNPEERVALYRAALERGAEPARRRQLLHSIGTIERYELMDPKAAIAAYRQALTDDQTDRAAHGALVELYTETEAWDDLCDRLEDYLGVASGAEEIRSTRSQLAQIATAHGQGLRGAVHALALLNDDQLSDAELDLVEDIATKLGDNVLLKAVLERRVRESADPKQQVECLGRLAALAERSGEPKVAIEKLKQGADIAKGMGDDHAAITMLERVRSITPKDQAATTQLVELLERTGSWERVPSLLSVLLELAADTEARVALLRRLSSTLANQLNDPSRAFDAARSAFSLSPASREVLAELADLAERAERTEDFATAIGEALATIGNDSTDSTWAELTLAKAHVLATKEATWVDASNAFRSVLERSKDEKTQENASTGLEDLLRGMPRSQQRTRDVRWLHGWRVEHATPETKARILFNWALAEENELGHEQTALELYRKVIEVDPDDLEALSAVSRLSLKHGDIEGALGALTARHAASEGEAKNALDVQIATILADRPGREGEALDRIAAVLETAPQDQGALALAAKLLTNAEVSERAAKVLETSLDAVEDPAEKLAIFDHLISHGDPRRERYERYLDTLHDLDRPEDAYKIALRAVQALPGEPALWDRAENIARQITQAEPLADTYEAVLRGENGLNRAEAIELGQRAVAFYEEWYEDSERVVRVLERLLEIDPEDTWAFDRLKLIFDAKERWDDLFSLYDRAAANAASSQNSERRLELLEEAAQIAKDFANHAQRAIRYFEQLLELKPGNIRLTAALERLYERHGCHRELITLRGIRLLSLPPDEAQRERSRIAALWLDELNDPSSALIVVEDIVSNAGTSSMDVFVPQDMPVSASASFAPPPPAIDVTTLLERILASAPKTADIKESLPPPPDGRRDSYLPMPPKRGLVRQRAAALLKERYTQSNDDANLARVLEVELEVVRSSKERIRRHSQLANLYVSLGNDDQALEHYASLVLLEPDNAQHRQELRNVAARINRYDRLVEVLVSAADDTHDDPLKVELLMSAGEVTAKHVGDIERAIELFFRILAITPIADASLLEACRHVEPLLAQADRRGDRLDVLERLAILEQEPDVKWHVLGEAARLATDLEEDDRAIWSWEGRIETRPGDPEALDGLVTLFDKAKRWRPLIDILNKRAAKEDRFTEQRRADRVRVARILADNLDASEEAIDTWRDIEERFGHSDDGTKALTQLLRAMQRWTELAEHLTGAADRAPNATDKAETLRELGDVQREQLDELRGAIVSYESSLMADPRNEGARQGLRALIKKVELRPEVVRVLLAAFVAADDWRLVLDLTEHRLMAAADFAHGSITPTVALEQVAILMESAEISEQRADEPDAAFALVRRALLLDPSKDKTVSEFFRLAEKTRSWRMLADTLRECIEGREDTTWARNLRFRMGEVLENQLEEPRSALDAYVHVDNEVPGELDAARAVIRVAGKTGRWDAAARALVEATRARNVLERSLVDAVEDAALIGSGWDSITFALASLVHDGAGLPAPLARDLEEVIAVWHRDRRGDPDAAESAYTRALTHDATNASLLAELAKLQRRARGRPLVDSLLRLSQSTGGDLDLLAEAAETAINSVGDRALAKSIYDRLLKLAAERWLGTTEPNVAGDATQAPDNYVDKATRELVKIYGDDADHDKVVALLLETAHLPWKTEKARSLRHEAARAAVEKLNAADRAIAIYLSLIDEDPHDDEAVKNLVALYETGGRRQDLLDLKRRLVGSAKDLRGRLHIRLEVAPLEDELGSVDKAIEALRENLSESGRHEATVKMLAQFLQREERKSELETLLASQAELAERAEDKKIASDFFQRAAEVAEKQMSDLPRAIGHLRRVVSLEERTNAYDALARLSTETKAFDEAAGFLDRLRELTDGKERAAVNLRLSDALVAANRKAEARAKLEAEVARDPDADSVRIRLAETYRAAQDWPALALLLTEGAHHAPDKALRLARLREAAELHRRMNEPEKAIPLLEQAVDLAPDENAVKLSLADALGAAQRFEEARTQLRTLVEAFGGRRPKERAPVHFYLARLDLAVGDRARALVELDAATRIDPANAEILLALAELARDDGQLERAERSYRALLTVLRRAPDPTDESPVTRSEVMFELSRIALRQDEADRSKEILESAFELATENKVEARRLEASLRKAADHLNLARALSSRLERGGAEDEAALRTELGLLFDQHLDRKDEALEMILRAIDLEPTNEAAHEAAFRLAASTRRLLNYEGRIRAIAEYTGTPADLAGMLFARLAFIAETEHKDLTEAAGLYERAIASRPKDRELISTLAAVYERLGDDAAQARILGMRVDLDTEAGGASADALYRLAQLRFRSGDVEAGCDAFEQAWESEPDQERAEGILKEAAEAHPQAVRVIDIYERLARADGRERTLVDALTRRWSLPGSSTEPMKEAVELAEKVEDKELAESLLRRYLERDSEDRAGRVWALGLLAWRCEESGRVREAAELKREAAELAEPEQARRFLFDVAGLASGPLNDLRLAASIYEELHEKENADRDAWEMLLDVYRRLEEFSKLVALLQRVVDFVDDPLERSKLKLEAVKIRMQKLKMSDEDASAELREIVDEYPANVDAAILLGSIFERGGREEDLASLLASQLEAAKDRQDAEAVSSLSRRLGQLLEKRDRSQAKDVYYAALDWDPHAREILVALERMHDEDADIEARSDVMERRLAIEHGEEAETLALTLHDTRRSLDDVEGALRALEAGFRGAPRSVQLRERLEAIYRETNEFAKLAELFVLDANGRQDAKEKSLRLREAAHIYSDQLSDPEKAAQILRDARAADTSDPLLLLEMVDTLSASGELKPAVDELGTALESVTEEDPFRIELISRRAVLRSRLNDMEGALEDFEEAVGAGKLELRAYLADHLGKMALQAAGRGDVALWRQHRLRIAGLRLEIGDIEEARSVLTELLKQDSKDKATLRSIAYLDELEEKWDQASATYRRLVGLEEGGGIVEAALKLLETCEKAGRLADARGGLERARVAAPEDAGLRERLAWLYEQIGALRELAELVLEDARAHGDVETRFNGLVRAGQLFLEAAADPNSGNPDPGDAIPALEEAHAVRPGDLDCAALLSDAYASANRLEEAQDLLLRTIGTFKGRRARELSALYHRLARIAEMFGDRNTELNHLTTALDMDAQNGVVASELAYLSLELGNLEVAQRALRQITMLKVAAPMPKAIAYQHLGEIARQQGDTRRAMMLLKRAIDDDPTLEEAKQLLDQLQAEGG
ncbi:MAG: tetratricopeptide repeat protein [Labilithrix sp.]